MKRKKGWIVSILSLAVVLIYFVTINISFKKVPNLIDIAGNREELQGIEVVASKNNDRYSSTIFNISNGIIEKEKTYYDWNFIANNFTKEDRKFYKSVSKRFDEIYEGEDSRFSASFSNEHDNGGKGYLTVNYRNKNTNEYIEFTKEMPRRDTIYGVYSEGDSQKIVTETSGQYGTGEIAILDVDLESEEITTEYSINLKDMFDIELISYISRGETNGNWNSMVYNHKIYLVVQKEFELGGIVSIDLNNGLAEFYSFENSEEEIWPVQAISVYENNIYFGHVDVLSNNTTKMAVFDIDSNTFKRYEDIKFSKELEEVWKIGYIENMKIYDDKLVLYYSNWLGSDEFKNFINVFDIKDSKSLYLGELTECRVLSLQ